MSFVHVFLFLFVVHTSQPIVLIDLCFIFVFILFFYSKKGQLYTMNYRDDRVSKLDLAIHTPSLLELLCPSSLDKAGSNFP